MKKWLFVFLVSLTVLSCSRAEDKTEDTSRIYFLGNLYGGPGINIFSVNVEQDLLQHTADRGSRDLDFALDSQGNLVFSSSRVVDQEQRRAARPAGRRMGRPQTFGVYYLQKGVLEEEKEHLAIPIASSEYHEVRPSISPDGRWISLVRAMVDDDEQRYEVLVVVDRTDDSVVEVASSDLIVKADWSPDSQRLLFSAHDYRAGEDDNSVLALFDPEVQEVTVLLESPWGNAQIDSPQWSPDGRKISMVSHPLGGSGARQLHIYDRASQALTGVSRDDVQVQVPVSWSPDGQQLAYGALVNYREYWSDELRTKVFEGGAQLFLSNVKGDYQQITQGETAIHTRPVFSPDGKRIAYMYAEEAPGRVTSLRVIDLDGKLLNTLYDRVAGNGYLIWR